MPPRKSPKRGGTAALTEARTSTCVLTRRMREFDGYRHTTDSRRGKNSREEKHERWSEVVLDAGVNDKEKGFDILPCKLGAANHMKYMR